MTTVIVFKLGIPGDKRVPLDPNIETSMGVVLSWFRLYDPVMNFNLDHFEFILADSVRSRGDAIQSVLYKLRDGYLILPNLRDMPLLSFIAVPAEEFDRDYRPSPLPA